MHRLSEVSLKDHTSPNKRLECSIFLNLSQALKTDPSSVPLKQKGRLAPAQMMYCHHPLLVCLS
jgi:hypothetical protein